MSFENEYFKYDFDYEDYIEKDAAVFLIEAFYLAIDRLNSIALIPGVRFKGEVVVLSKNKTMHKQLSKFTDLVSIKNTNQSKLLGIVDVTQQSISDEAFIILNEYNIPILKSMTTSKSYISKSNHSLYARTYNTFATLIKPLTAVLQQMKWHQVQLVNLVDSEANQFVSEMNKSHIQIDKTYSIYNLFLEVELPRKRCNKIAEALINNSSSSVIVLLLNAKNEKCLMESIHTKSVKTKFHWISIKFQNEKINYTGVESTASGHMSLYYQPVSNITEIMSEYVKSINVERNTRNPLFQDYVSQRACEMIEMWNSSDFIELCPDNKIREFPHASFNELYIGVVDAVYAFAFALRNAITHICGPHSTYCERAQNVSTDVFFHTYLMNVVFIDITGKQKFAFYNKQRKFKVQLEQFREHAEKYETIKVGDYAESALNFAKYPVCVDNFTSWCYPTCKNGYRKVENKRNICCWICEKCGNNEIAVNNTECVSCKLGEVPNINQTDCRPIDLIDIFTALQRVEGKFTELEKRMRTLEDTKCNQ
ncbi:metabotropic glutamate receptor 3-like isoform X1 [Leptotrombidium deliense]|uniref:Metabotropic glutamate receptor 3-like isoform X1 n=1 Tax=Leptotrombidium deliense TaxID=299467 RepID=A0A443SHY2_9ACAR|nr:metabotropic glutamate receptor 3-like isoform X1 [Leptotrombidium deliense]